MNILHKAILLLLIGAALILHAAAPATQPQTQPQPQPQPQTLPRPASRPVPAPRPPNRTNVHWNIPFAKAGDTPLLLNIAVPSAGDAPLPTIIFLYGGGWQGGSFKDLTPLLLGAAIHGFVTIAPEYRLVPKAHFPAQIYDCKAAVRWARANAKQYKIDPDRIYVVGFSAGAHLASLLGLTSPADGLDGIPAPGQNPGQPPDPNALTDANPDQSSQVQAVVSFFGPTDFTTRNWHKKLEDDVINPFLGGSFADIPDTYKKASPITYASKSAPPMLLIHGTADEIVPVEQSKQLAQKLKDLGVTTELLLLENEKHTFSPTANEKALGRTLAFLAAQPKK